jgi:hypothetical protein
MSKNTALIKKMRADLESVNGSLAQFLFENAELKRKNKIYMDLLTSIIKVGVFSKEDFYHLEKMIKELK